MGVHRGMVALGMALMLLAPGGCMVSKGRFDMQLERTTTLEEENAALLDEIAALQQRSTDLASENIALTEEVESLKRQSFTLETEKERLAAERQLLQQTIAAERQTYDTLLEEMKGEVAKGQITISELKGRLTLNMVEEILFDSGQAVIKPAGLDVLTRVAQIIKDVKDKGILVEGHTDNVPIGPALARIYPTNWELSAARAVTVTRFLEQQGVEPGRLCAAAYGEHRPVADNATPEGKARNRRIAIILTPPD